MTSSCFPITDEYVVPDAVVFSMGYDSNLSTGATVSIAPEWIVTAIFSFDRGCSCTRCASLFSSALKKKLNTSVCFDLDIEGN